MDSISAREIGESGGSMEGDLRLALDAVGFSPFAHYPLFDQWSRARGGNPIPIENLGRGIVTRFNGIPVAMGFLYPTDAKLGIFEFAIADPAASPEIRSQALNLLIESILDSAKQLGLRGLFTFTNHRAWLDRLKGDGWIETDKGCSQLYMRVE